MAFNILLILFFLFGISRADNCDILGQIMKECVENPYFSCEEKQIILFYSLEKKGIKKETSKSIVKLCGYYCKAPFEFNKKTFVENCKNSYLIKEKDKHPLLDF